MLLLRPRFTLATMVGGLAAMGGMAVTTILSLVPLESMQELRALRPWIIGVDTVLGAIAGICLVGSAIGRSILWWVDHDVPEPPKSAPPR